jgi:molybdate transport system ATP-binding protein
VTVLFGPSGSGKTTVLRCLAGLDRPDRGTIRFGSEVWFDSAQNRFVPPQQRGVGLVLQDHALFPHLTVARNLGYGLFRLPRGEREARVAEVARLAGLAGLLTRRPRELSGGERQRVALGRALAPRPRLLLLDEPLSALDAPAREELRGELRRLLRASGVPALVVTHDRVEALALGDRLAVLAEGAIRQVGPVGEVFQAPADLAVARVVGTENVLAAHVLSRDQGLVTLEVGSARLVAVDPGGALEEAFACIRAEEVVLEEAPGAPSSARNLLAGTVAALLPEGATVRVTLDCGFRLVALVTRRSAEELGLAAGRRVAALVKAPAVRLVPREARRGP